LTTKSLVCKFSDPDARLSFGILSYDDSVIRCSASGPYVWEIDLTKDCSQRFGKFDIIGTSGWDNFALSLDGKTLI
jgi:hypothetical protein